MPASRSDLQAKIRSETKITSANGVESLEQVSLNGSKQWIYARGQNRSNPILLFLHGGPGSTEMHSARYFGLELEKHFTVVHWDQRESGKSRTSNADLSALTIDIYLADTLALIDLLRTRFKQDKIFLLGHSWGSVLGVLMVRNHPDLFHGYAGMGQVVNIVAAESYSHDWVLRKARNANNETAINELSNISPPYDKNPAELFVHRKWLNDFGGSTEKDLKDAMPSILASPEYTVDDLEAVEPRARELLVALWPRITKVNFFEQTPELDVPVIFLAGRHDHHTPSSFVEDYCEQLVAPSKKVIWFEHSAHAPNFAEPEKFQKVVITNLLGQ